MSRLARRRVPVEGGDSVGWVGTCDHYRRWRDARRGRRRRYRRGGRWRGGCRRAAWVGRGTGWVGVPPTAASACWRWAVGLGVDCGVDVAMSSGTPPGVPTTMLGGAIAVESGLPESASAKMTTTLRMTKVQRANTPYRTIRSLGRAGRLATIPERDRLDPTVGQCAAAGWDGRADRQQMVELYEEIITLDAVPVVAFGQVGLGSTGRKRPVRLT